MKKMMVIFVVTTIVCVVLADINEYFDTLGTWPPTSWSAYSIDQSSTYQYSGSYSAKFSSGDDWLKTPLINSAYYLRFYSYVTSSDPSIIVEYSTDNITWIEFSESPFTGNTERWNERVIDTSSLEPFYIRWKKTGTGNLYIDDVLISTDTPLPVTLSSFTVSAVMNSYINIEWSTASESQLNCFNVYRDGEIIGSVEATNTTQTQFYRFADHQAEPGNTYHYWLEVVELDGSTTMFGPQSVTLEQQGEPGQPAIPQVYGLYQNYPNPFNPTTEISFSVPGTTTGELVVYACNGQLVKRLFRGQIEAQEVYRITWDGTDSSGKAAASGLYFYRLQTETASLHKKMILMR